MPNLNLIVGRVRVTRAVSPAEPGYLRSIRNQMKVIEQNLRKVIKQIKFVTPQAIVFGLQPIFDRSQELVPVDTGVLKRSGFLEVDTEQRSGHVRVQIGYGKHGRPHYTAFVHEMLHFRHAKGTSAKFLEFAVNEKIHLFPSRTFAYMKQNVGFK